MAFGSAGERAEGSTGHGRPVPAQSRGLGPGPVHPPWPGLWSWRPAEQTSLEAAFETHWLAASSSRVADEAVVTPPLSWVVTCN